MGLIDVGDFIAADFIARSVPAIVYYGQQYKAQDDAGQRIVIVPNRDKYSMKTFMSPLGTNGNGANPRPVRTREAGALVQIWSKATKQSQAINQPAAEWRALDALINQFVLSLHRANPNNYELGEGIQNTTTSHVQHGMQYNLQLWISMPIVDTAWVTQDDVGAGLSTYLRMSPSNGTSVLPTDELYSQETPS